MSRRSVRRLPAALIAALIIALPGAIALGSTDRTGPDAPVLGHRTPGPNAPPLVADGPYALRAEATSPAGANSARGTPANADTARSSTTETPALQVDSTGPHLEVTGPLVEVTEWSVGADPQVDFHATDSGSGVTSVGLLVDGRQVGQLTQACPSGGCDLEGILQAGVTQLAAGQHSYEIVATDGAGNTTDQSGTFRFAATSESTVVPKPVPAWYMTAPTVEDLRDQAAHDACAFARAQPNKSRVLLLDFGKADLYAGQYGAQLRTGPHFRNAQILDAMKAAAREYRSTGRCYRQGSMRITYGNTNNMPTTMDELEVTEAGHLQALTARRVLRFQRRGGPPFAHQGVAVAGDIEPQWNPAEITKILVDAAAADGLGGLYFNYGAASGCPPERPSCDNHWDIGDLAQVSFGGVKKPLPEIYRPVHAEQWTHVRQHWDSHHPRELCFYGATATPGFPLSPTEGWRRLEARNPCVRRELVEIRDN